MTTIPSSTGSSASFESRSNPASLPPPTDPANLDPELAPGWLNQLAEARGWLDPVVTEGDWSAYDRPARVVACPWPQTKGGEWGWADTFAPCGAWACVDHAPGRVLAVLKRLAQVGEPEPGLYLTWPIMVKGARKRMKGASARSGQGAEYLTVQRMRAEGGHTMLIVSNFHPGSRTAKTGFVSVEAALLAVRGMLAVPGLVRPGDRPVTWSEGWRPESVNLRHKTSGAKGDRELQMAALGDRAKHKAAKAKESKLIHRGEHRGSLMADAFEEATGVRPERGWTPEGCLGWVRPEGMSDEDWERGRKAANSAAKTTKDGE